MRAGVGAGSQSGSRARAIGNGKIQLGQAEEAEAHIQEALRLSPRDTYAYLWCFFAGSAKLRLGGEEEAVAWLRRSIETNRSFPGSHFALAAALARLGRLRRSALRGPGGAGAPPDVHPLAVSRWRAERRQPRRDRRIRAHHRRPAQSRSPRAMTAARRLAAILAADVVGYSRLMGGRSVTPGSP